MHGCSTPCRSYDWVCTFTGNYGPADAKFLSKVTLLYPSLWIFYSGSSIWKQSDWIKDLNPGWNWILSPLSPPTPSPNQREGMGLPEYQASCLLCVTYVAHDWWLCTFAKWQQLEIPSARSWAAPVKAAGTVRKRQALWPSQSGPPCGVSPLVCGLIAPNPSPLRPPQPKL